MERSQSLNGKAPVRMAERKSGKLTSEIDGRHTVRKDEGKGWRETACKNLILWVHKWQGIEDF